MAFPIKTCVVCGDEFELRPNKPGFANRCPDCSAEDEAGTQRGRVIEAEFADSGIMEARRKAMRDLLYRKDQ
jgi:hypothetical protein